MFVLDEEYRTPRNFEENECSRRASSRGIIPRAKIKTVKMTFVIVFGKYYCKLFATPYTLRNNLLN